MPPVLVAMALWRGVQPHVGGVSLECLESGIFIFSGYKVKEGVAVVFYFQREPLSLARKGRSEEHNV